MGLKETCFDFWYPGPYCLWNDRFLVIVIMETNTSDCNVKKKKEGMRFVIEGGGILH